MLFQLRNPALTLRKPGRPAERLRRLIFRGG